MPNWIDCEQGGRFRLQVVAGIGKDLFCLENFSQVRDHREHDAQVSPCTGLQKRAQLAGKYIRAAPSVMRMARHPRNGLASWLRPR